jgi:Raf kinase inhibitor-like YbhB/YbcL family protein
MNRQTLLQLSAISLALVGLASCKREGPAINTADTAMVPAPYAGATDTTSRETAMSFELTSSAFKQGGSIPSKYTCEGSNASPPLGWSGAPDKTKSFALIVDDPDAPDPAKPQRVYVHWVIYGMPAGTASLDENASKGGLPAGAKQGKNDFGKTEYGGPCPPIGRHRYFFKLYALDTELSGLSSPGKADVEAAMKNHVVAQAELMGTYQKSGK